MDFDALGTALENAGAPVGAAECHGALTGWLASGLGGDPLPLLASLLEELETDAEAAGRCQELLVGVHAALRQDLDGAEFRFAPLLPADDAPLAERVAALAAWCEGFLFGLGLAGEVAAQGGEEVREVIEDFAQIARAGMEDGGGTEADEVAYAELVEYLRAGTQLVHEALAAAPPAARRLH